MNLEASSLEMIRDTLMVVIRVATPLLMIGMIIGLLISLVQSITSIQDQTLTFVPKILGVIVLAILLLPWTVETLMAFTTEMFRLF
ncbi:MAG: flagellar biosynthetic protein FliQ [Phycisphaerales bacterium]|nr:flagellar biosynthetic protein FliQ [Phycisphaerales bacterium]